MKYNSYQNINYSIFVNNFKSISDTARIQIFANIATPNFWQKCHQYAKQLIDKSEITDPVHNKNRSSSSRK